MNEVPYLGKSEPIHPVASNSGTDDQSCHAKDAQLLRDDGLRHVETRRNGSDVLLLAPKGREDLQAYWVTGGFQDFCRLRSFLLIHLSTTIVPFNFL